MQISGIYKEKCHINFPLIEQTSKGLDDATQFENTLPSLVINIDISLTFEISSHFFLLTAVGIATTHIH